jgi:hypothetical protein
MMNNRILLAGALLLLLVSCSGGPAEKTEAELIAEVTAFEDSLKTAKSDMAVSTTSVKYADKCLAVYRNFPDSKEAPKYLDKAHIILSSAGMHNMAVLYADTLIRNYPAYENRPMVLQSLATAYDIFIVPRRKDLVKKYYNLLLTENPKLPQEEKENIRYRLDHIDMTFDQLIEEQSKAQMQ